MAKKYYVVFLDDGHGAATAGKRTPVIARLKRAVKENEFNKPVVKKLASILKESGHFIVVEVAPTDADTPLNDRTALANKKFKEYQNKYGKENVEAIYISIHYDALSNTWSSAEGHSIFVYDGQSNKSSGKLANAIAKYLKQGTSQKWRGIKEENFAVLRDTLMPAILSENGFMSNKREADLMLNTNFHTEVATEHAKGIHDYWGLKYVSAADKKAAEAKKKAEADKKKKEEEAKKKAEADKKKQADKDGTTFRLIAGSFKDEANAKARMGKLKEKNIASFQETKTVAGKKVFRVVAGSFSNKENATKEQKRLKELNFETFIEAKKK